MYIYIHKILRDASWETKNAFADLYVKYEKCDAKPCKYPKDAKLSKKNR